MEKAPQTERCYGVDCLKIISMFFVVIVHILNQGGVLGGFAQKDAAFWTAWMMDSAVVCCVNCFALATGYLMAGRKVRYRKLLPMWMTVAFYCGVALLVERYVLHQTTYLVTVLRVLFPVSARVYWYFTAYCCMFLFLPYVNQLLDGLSRRQHARLLIIGFFLFSVPQVVNVTRLHATDFVGLQEGYSMFWLMYLYVLGAGMKKYGFFCGLRSSQALLGYGAMVALTWLSKYGYSHLPERVPGIVASIVREYGGERFINYLSPTVVAAAVFLSVACINWNVPRWMRKPLCWLSPLVFQVYIIHTHPLPFAAMGLRFAFLAEGSLAEMVVGVLGIAAGIFLACIGVDWLRLQLFRLLGVERRLNQLADWAARRGQQLLEKQQQSVS